MPPALGPRQRPGAGRNASPLAVLALAVWPLVAPGAHAQAVAARSGFDEMTPALQAMQRDDTRNPAMLWVAEGERLWSTPAGEAKRSCASCHGSAKESMRGVAARHPAYDEHLARPLTLAQRIAQCRQRQQRADPLDADGEAALGLAAYVAMQSRGLPITPSADPRLAPWRERGERLYAQRIGQLDLACAHCHDQRAGQRLGGTPIPQGHANGYPLYRLEWQSLGSLARRVRNCMSGVRAEPWAADSDEMVALELHLAGRAAGLPVETPAVRP